MPADGMSGGAEQADILSVFSVVKERWKVVSGCIDNEHRVCPSSPAPSQPVHPCRPVLSSHCTTTVIITTNSNSRPLFRTHRASHVSHLSCGQPGVASLCLGRGRCSARRV